MFYTSIFVVVVSAVSTAAENADLINANDTDSYDEISEFSGLCLYNTTIEKVHRALILGITVLSILTCLTAFTIYFLLRNVSEFWQDSRRHWIHWNFMASYIFRDLVILVYVSSCHAVNFTLSPTYYIFSVLGFYVIATNFFWMFVEGLHLFLGLILHLRLRQLTWMKLKLSLIGWGLPFLLVATWTIEQSVTSGTFLFGETEGLIVLVPMYLVLLANLLMMGRVLSTLGQMIRMDRRRSETIRTLAKRTIILSFLLGVYIVIPVIIHKATQNVLANYITHFIFSIVSQTQGLFVAVLYVLLNEEVMNHATRHLPIPLQKPIEHILHVFRRLSTSSTVSSRNSRSRLSALSTANGGLNNNIYRNSNSSCKTSVSNYSPSISPNASPSVSPGVTPHGSPRSSRASSVEHSPQNSPGTSHGRYLTPGSNLERLVSREDSQLFTETTFTFDQSHGVLSVSRKCEV